MVVRPGAFILLNASVRVPTTMPSVAEPPAARRAVVAVEASPRAMPASFAG
ncbi:MAG: hypothetical protein JWM10_307, partial [Myxococcaceae bacterium]|nr:hypothetical protein [Myxococcaceae bacterium]